MIGNVAQHNISKQYPSLANTLNNSYQAPFKLFVKKTTILSKQGSILDHPFAMAIYDIATLPLISCVQTAA